MTKLNIGVQNAYCTDLASSELGVPMFLTTASSWARMLTQVARVHFSAQAATQVTKLRTATSASLVCRTQQSGNGAQ